MSFDRSKNRAGAASAGKDQRLGQAVLLAAFLAIFVSPIAHAAPPSSSSTQAQTTTPPTPTAPTGTPQAAPTPTFLVTGQYGAIAVQTKPTVAQAPDWANKSQYSDCGQDCLYQKGNENISIQALYVVNKISNIQNILNNGSFSQTDYDSIMGEMAPYCPDIQPQSGFDSDKANDDATKCFQRYMQVQIPLLKKLKAAIVQNEDSSSRLQTNQRLTVQGGASAGAKQAMVFSVPSDGKPKKPQTPEFETEDELLSTPQGQKKLQVLASESYARWASDQLQAVEPRKEDYVVTVDVPRDPQNPGSETVTRIVRNPDGSPKLDEKAFVKAHAEYLAQMTETPADESFRQLAVDPKILSQKLKVGSLDPVTRQQGVGKGKALEYKLDEISYEQARNQAVKATTDLLMKQGVLFGGAGGGQKKAGLGNQNAAQKAAKHQVNANANFGAANVLKTPTGPGLDKNGNAVQQQVLPNKGVDADYTVSFKPAEIEKASDDFENLLDETDKGVKGSVTYGQGSGNGPAPTQAGGKAPAAPAPAQTATDSSVQQQQRVPANHGDDGKNFLPNSPYTNGGLPPENNFGDTTGASRVPPANDSDSSQ